MVSHALTQQEAVVPMLHVTMELVNVTIVTYIRLQIAHAFLQQVTYFSYDHNLLYSNNVTFASDSYASVYAVTIILMH